jgi:hypothetical protein
MSDSPGRGRDRDLSPNRVPDDRRETMSKKTMRERPLPVEEAWLADWAAVGLAALERYLAKQAAFAAYLRDMEDSGDGDGRTSA